MLLDLWQEFEEEADVVWGQGYTNFCTISFYIYLNRFFLSRGDLELYITVATVCMRLIKTLCRKIKRIHSFSYDTPRVAQNRQLITNTQHCCIIILNTFNNRCH